MRISRRAARTTLLIGTFIAAFGLSGFWLWPRPDSTELNTVQQQLLGIGRDDFHVSALIAGRDVTYNYSSSEPIYNQAGDIVCWRPNGTRSVRGVNTDTIIYASLTGDELTMVSIPRDLFTGNGHHKVNELIASGPEALKNHVSDLLGVPIDHYVILNIEIFKNLVDDLGGIEVDVPQRMYYQDCAGGLDIDIQPGLQVLDGDQAVSFVRFRSMPRADLDRLANLKQLALAGLRRLKELNVTAVTRVPALLDTFMSDVETDVTPSVITALLPRIGSINFGNMATLPTIDAFVDGHAGLTTDPAEVEWFLASVFGGSAREFAGAPEPALVITDRSGVEGALDWYLNRLRTIGVPQESVVVRSEEFDGNPTRMRSTIAGWDDAGYYASLFSTGIQEVNRLGAIDGATRQFELVLGGDALDRTRLAPAFSPRVDPVTEANLPVIPN